MTVVQAAAGPGARFHLLKVLLTLSLALNLFFVVGALWIRIHAPPPPISPEQRLEQMSQELGLNPQQKAASARYWQAMRERMQMMRDAVRPQIAKAWSEVANPRADEVKVMQLLDQAAQTRHHYVHDLTATTLAYLATLSPEQRTKFVALMQKVPHPWSPPRSDHDDAR
jgi:Spy/CpxP family protein refolding chaperone